MRNGRHGFTLMEIMVVIIVIAVLASVGSSMINTFVDQSKTTATKQKLDSLRKALLAYQADVGRMPHTGDLKCSRYEAAYNGACSGGILSYNNEDANVLLSPDPLPNSLKKKWRGPYMDSDPSEFMYDAWLNPIHYVAKGKLLFLWSYGSGESEPDGEPEEVLKRYQDQDDYIDDVMEDVFDENTSRVFISYSWDSEEHRCWVKN